jgi:hypothetical protein
MMPVVVPFPPMRRIEFVRTHAWRLLEKSGERHLTAQLRRQADTMRRRGIDPTRIVAELGALEAAIRCVAAQIARRQGGAA